MPVHRPTSTGPVVVIPYCVTFVQREDEPCPVRIDNEDGEITFRLGACQRRMRVRREETRG